MNRFNIMKCSVLQWARGSPPLDEKVYETIYKEFNVFLFLSGLFLDLRPKYWFVTAIYAFFEYIAMLVYTGLGVKTVLLQTHDLPRAAESSLIMLIMTNILIGVVMVNFRRSDFVGLFHSMSENYFDYQDGEVIEEMEEEMVKFRKQKMFVLLICPIYCVITAIMALSGRYLDVYFGAVPANTAYENEVYMLLPRPVWFPFKVNNNFRHFFALVSQLCVAWAMAAYYIGYLAMKVGFSQSLALQFKILKFRIRKLPHFAYKLYKQTGRNRLHQREMFDNPYFRECYNKYLDKCAAHHAILVRNFIHLRRINEWQYYIGMLLVAIMMAFSLLVLVTERARISILSFGFMAFAICLINTAVLVQQTELILDISDSISEELYDTNWVDVDQRAKKTMILMMERMKQPLAVMTAVTNTPFNWETYATMLNSAYSYVNLLIALRQSE